jgi:hypothetical protein
MRARLLLGLGAVLALGCGARIAPVSGKVTLNGQPLPHASVSFQPIAPPGVTDPGPGSAGTTDEKGEYTLQTSTGQKGALVGKHRVRISLLRQEVAEGDQRPPRGGWPLANKVPRKYNDDSTLEIEVPSGGKNDADFPLTSP